MAIFDWFKNDLESIEAQGCKVDPAVSKMTRDHNSQANEADRLFQEKQARDREERKSRRNQ